MDISWRIDEIQGYVMSESKSMDISWRMDEVNDRPVATFSNEAMRMPAVKFEEVRITQRLNEKSTGMMIDEYSLELEMFSRGPVWREAEPVFVAAESEVYTPVCKGEFVENTDPLVVEEAVTSRVSALLAVGNDFQTSLSTAVGRADRFSMNSGAFWIRLAMLLVS